jgi:acyl carrier protein
MTLEQFNTAVRPKVHGALNLHNATINANANLDFFFMTSSTVTYVGHISQSNYAASNAVLDNLSRQRIRNGLPAATISLGPIKGVGTLNRKPEYSENLLRSGLIEAEESEFIRHFNRFTHPQQESKHFDSLTQGHILTGVEYSKHDLSMVQVTRIEQDRRSALLVTTLESRKAAGNIGGVVADASGDDLLISDIPDDRDKAVIVLADAVAKRLAKLMFIPIEDIDISRPFSHFGLDSMSGSELIHWLSQKFGVGMSFLQLLAPSCSPKSLAGTIFDTLMKAKAAVAETAPVTNGTDSKAHEKANEHAESNGLNGSNGVKGSNGVHGVNGLNGASTETRMDKFSQSVRRAIADPKPVMHSYVCSVINTQGTWTRFPSQKRCH